MHSLSFKFWHFGVPPNTVIAHQSINICLEPPRAPSPQHTEMPHSGTMGTQQDLGYLDYFPLGYFLSKNPAGIEFIESRMFQGS